MSTKKTYTVVGKRVPRIDAKEKARGEAKYVDDLTLPGMLYGATLRTPYAHARILSIDTSKAEELPGVKAVITGKDLPDRKFSFIQAFYPGREDKLPLEKEKARYIGDEIAAVAAVNLETAKRALELIDIKYEVLPTVIDPEEAMEASSPKIHDKERNVVEEVHDNFGDVDKSFKEADYIFEDRFRVSHQAHCCMETHGCIAQWGDDGRLTIWSSTQMASHYQWELSEVLGIPYGDIRVIRTTLGGSFGSKQAMHTIEPIAAYLAKKACRPVKLVYNREEEFLSTRTRHPAIFGLKTAVKKDGTITGREVKIILDNGAYNDMGPGLLHDMSRLFCSYYKVPNVRVNGYCVYTNKGYGSAFRGFSNPQTAFAIESQMDIIAKKLNIDPVELRLKNAVHTGDVAASGWVFPSCGLSECIEKAAAAIGWKEKRGKANKRGVGLATCTHWGGGLTFGQSDFCGTIVEINSGGLAYIRSGEVEMGQGSDTEITQIVAETLGFDIKDVKLMPLDTDLCPSFDYVGSPVTYVAGGAAKSAASDAKRQILELAAEMKALNTSDLDTMNGYIYDIKSGEKVMPVSEAAHFSYEIRGVPIIGKSSFHQGPTMFSGHVNPDGSGTYSPTYSFAAQAAEVEVDPTTGLVKVLEFITAQDVGKAINPMGIEGQADGGVAQGLGYALTEGLEYNSDGKLLNADYGHYRIFRAQDMPRKLTTILVETEDPGGPFGAKAVGETSMVPTAAAIANAIEDAVGVRIKELPITPFKVLEALIKNKKEK